jgi:glucosyl-3-phosphoglycerate phosphatase
VIKLVLWRHGQTDFNAQRRFQGQTDIPLNAVGLRQAERAAPFLAALGPDALFSSDLSRASGTAQVLAQLTGRPVQFDKDLRERSGGSWEGLTDTEIRERYPEAFAHWMPPDGESSAAVGDRASAALLRIADDLPDGSLAVVVGHGGNLGMGLARLLGIPDDLRILGSFGNCNWSVVARRHSRWRLLEHNVGYLAQADSQPAIEAGPPETVLERTASGASRPGLGGS